MVQQEAAGLDVITCRTISKSVLRVPSNILQPEWYT